MSNGEQFSIQGKGAASITPAAHQLKEKASGTFLTDNRSNAPVQLKSTVKYIGQTYNMGGGEHSIVGKEMHAWLDPDKPLRGQSAGVNSSQEALMHKIRKEWNIVGGNVVKGHLLNDNLGGNALSTNLYPITKGANSAHLGYVENVAKSKLWKEHEGIYYNVKVGGTPNIDYAVATFKCTINEWDPDTNTVGDLVLGALVRSDLDDVKSKDAYHDVEPIKGQDELEREKNPKKPKFFTNPATAVRDLNESETEYRDMDNEGTLPLKHKWTAK